MKFFLHFFSFENTYCRALGKGPVLNLILPISFLHSSLSLYSCFYPLVLKTQLLQGKPIIVSHLLCYRFNDQRMSLDYFETSDVSIELINIDFFSFQVEGSEIIVILDIIIFVAIFGRLGGYDLDFLTFRHKAAHYFPLRGNLDSLSDKGYCLTQRYNLVVLFQFHQNYKYSI